jgi:solute carrier family 25 S-adenosylmethionine transporter 26
MGALKLPSRRRQAASDTLLAFELQASSQAPRAAGRRLLRTACAAAPVPLPFASVAMSAPPAPLFTVASVAERRGGAAAGPPRWRLAAGNLAAGATAGCAVEAVLYPIDTVKTRMQAMRSGGGLRALLQAGGGRALYAGLWGNLAGVIPASAIFMAVYEPVKAAVVAAVPPERDFLGPLAAGVAAGLASSVVRVPTEVVKTRMQTGEFARAAVALRHIAAKEGARGLFAGYGSFLLRDLPFDAIQFGMYEQLKVLYKARALGGRRELEPAEHSVFGAAAGAATGLVTTPLDVVKTRLMTQGGAAGAQQYRGALDCARKVVAAEGAGALMRGWQPRVLWIGVGGSVFFAVLEQAKKLYNPPPPRPCCAGKKR